MTTVSAPTPMNLYPVDVASNNPARLFIFVTAVGSQTVQMPLAFDTGSAGITLNALAIFPMSIVTAAGFNFGGRSTISLNGITVTQLNGTRTYGGATGRTEIGNLGFATVTFGDSMGSFATQQMPVFLYYALQSNTSPPTPEEPQAQDGWFGVNDAPDAIKLGTSTANAPECSESVTGSCYVGSVFKYLKYASGVDAGFVLSRLQIQGHNCDITSPGACSPAAALAVGLNSSSASGFTLTNLPCPPSGYTGPAEINGYAVCEAYVPETSISVTGSPNEAFSSPVVFDTGTPFFIFNIPSGTAVPATVASFQLTTASGFVYSATAGSDIFTVKVQPLPATAQGSVVGLPYFQTNSLLTDFTTGMQGWK